MPLTRTWAKSSYSDPNGGNCVEARQPGTGTVQVRDSKDTSGPVLSFSSRLLADVHRHRPRPPPGRLAAPGAMASRPAPEPPGLPLAGTLLRHA